MPQWRDCDAHDKQRKYCTQLIEYSFQQKTINDSKASKKRIFSPTLIFHECKEIIKIKVKPIFDHFKSFFLLLLLFSFSIFYSVMMPYSEFYAVYSCFSRLDRKWMRHYSIAKKNDKHKNDNCLRIVWHFCASESQSSNVNLSK